MEMYRCPLDPVSMVAASRWGLHLFFLYLIILLQWLQSTGKEGKGGECGGIKNAG